MKIPMLARFSAYGFLKNQQYYEPFLMLVFIEKGLSFTLIGLLYGFRELSVNVMEVPSGAVADLCGRRGSMVLSLSSYIASFLVFGLSATTWHLFAAMFLFAVGEAFRTGTHKSMIMEWLRIQDREGEKTRTYGYTRSWSKLGSAVAVLIGPAIVLATGRFSHTFLFATIPYALGIVNFLGYPRELEGERKPAPSMWEVAVHLYRAFARAFTHLRLLRVLAESMAYEGTYKVVKDYVQPVIKQMAVALPVFAAMAVNRRTALLVPVVCFPLHLLSSVASRKSSWFAGRYGGESRAARRLWLVTLLVSVPIGLALWYGVMWLAALGFVALAVLQNFWRPMLVTRVDNETDPGMGATMLSIESQAKSAGAMVLAPLLGYAVDRLAAGPEQPALWVVGLVAAGVALAGVLLPAMRPAPAEAQAADDAS